MPSRAPQVPHRYQYGGHRVATRWPHRPFSSAGSAILSRGGQMMRNTYRRQYESVARITALCLEHRAELEQTPLGKQLVAELEQQKATAADGFTSQSAGRNTAHVGTVQRRDGVKTLRTAVDRLL